MDGEGWPKILTLLMLLLAAAYFASAEITYASINRIKLNSLIDRNNKKAKNVKYILDNFDNALISLLIGNNIASIGFASLVTSLTTYYLGAKYVSLMTLVTTLIIFLFSEMIPKSYARENLNYALKISTSLKILMKLFKPINFVFLLLSDFLSKLFPSAKGPQINEQELYEIIKIVGEEGSITDEKHDLMMSAFNFDIKTVKSIYKPIEDVEYIYSDMEKDKILEFLKESIYSRFPVYDKKENKFVGLIQKKQLFKEYIANGDFNIDDLCYKAYNTGLNQKIDELLQGMNSKKNHLALVEDNNKNIIGIVSVEDILEELVGEIWDEEDSAQVELDKEVVKKWSFI